MFDPHDHGFYIHLQAVEKEEGQIKMTSETKYQVAGWVLFIICAIFFMASSWKNHDTLTFIGSIIFLIACIVFLIPIFSKPKNEQK